MDLPDKILVKLYTDMVRVRKLDEKFLECLKTGRLRTFYHSGQGMEATGVALCSLLRKDDYLFYNHRSHGTNKCLPRGISARELLAEHFGKATGGGRGFAGHNFVDLEKGIFGKAGMVGGEMTIAAGVGIACGLNGKQQVVACCFGDGATGRGPFHEAMLMAANWKLPVLWICENNFYAQWTHVRLTYPKENLADLAFGYGTPSIIADGQNVLDVYKAIQSAIERARSGEGPTFLEVKTYRYRGHSEGHPVDYSVECVGGARPQEEIEAWKKRDPIELLKVMLQKKGILKESDIKMIDKKATQEMNEAEQFAEESPYPDSKDFSKALYAQ